MRSALQHSISLISGGAGSGKSYTISVINTICEESDLEVVLAAPTGKAAKRLEEVSGRSGTTLQWFASNDGGLTWEAMTIQDTRPIDENWTEYTLVRTFIGNKVRYKAEMTGTPLIYPRIHSLGATLS